MSLAASRHMLVRPMPTMGRRAWRAARVEAFGHFGGYAGNNALAISCSRSGKAAPVEERGWPDTGLV